MKHLADDELTLLYYRDGDDVQEAARHLASCAECRSRFNAIEEVLKLVVASPVPSRSPEYSSEVWNRIRAELPDSIPKRSWLWLRPWMWAPAFTALLLVLFFVGRYAGHRDMSNNTAINSNPISATVAQQLRERVLLVAVGDHLDRSQILLMELTHATAAGEIDISQQTKRAIELANASRLYRATAQQVGNANIASLLEELERVLVQVGHQPRIISAPDLKEIQDSIQSQGILFKVRVVSSNVRRQSAQRTKIASTQDEGKAT